VAKTHGWVRAKGRQRTDSTHVLAAAVRTLNRLELVGARLRHTLNVLAAVAPEWLRAWVPGCLGASGVVCPLQPA
jgi:transposase